MGMEIRNKTGVWNIDMLQGYGNSASDRDMRIRHAAGVWDIDMSVGYEKRHKTKT